MDESWWKRAGTTNTLENHAIMCPVVGYSLMRVVYGYTNRDGVVTYYM